MLRHVFLLCRWSAPVARFLLLPPMAAVSARRQEHPLVSHVGPCCRSSTADAAPDAFMPVQVFTHQQGWSGNPPGIAARAGSAAALHGHLATWVASCALCCCMAPGPSTEPCMPGGVGCRCSSSSSSAAVMLCKWSKHRALCEGVLALCRRNLRQCVEPLVCQLPSLVVNGWPLVGVLTRVLRPLSHAGPPLQEAPATRSGRPATDGTSRLGSACG